MALPSINVANLAEAVQNSQFTPQAKGSSEVFCKFDYQTGDFLLGRDADDISGEEVIIHTDSIAIGWVCWSEGKPNKQLVSFTEQLPPQPAPIGANDYVEARAVMFKTEDDEQAVLEGNSYGIRSGIDELIMSIKQRAMDPANSNHLYPKVKLGSSSYKHSTGNLIHNPEFKIIAWCDVDGIEQGETKAVEAPEEEVKPRKRRRAA